MKLLCRWLVLTVATSLLLAIGALSAAPASAQRACKDVTFVGVRGSGEELTRKNRGMGASVFRMGTRLRQRLKADGEEVGLLPIPYSALGVETLVPSRRQLALAAAGRIETALAFYYRNNVRKYLGSIDEGVELMLQALETTTANCPDTDLVLAGYSQGAMVVHQAELRLSDAEELDVLDAVWGTILLADGDRVPNSGARLIGTSQAHGQGVRTNLGGNDRRDVVSPETTVNICNKGDIVCDFNASRILGHKKASKVHTQYRSGALLDEAVDWLLEDER